MNILITGAAGFVGAHLSSELTSNGHNVIAAINNNEQPPTGVEYVNADLSDPNDFINKEFDFKKVDAIIHLAGLAAVGPSFDEPLKYININAGIEINIYEAFIAHDSFPIVLMISSGTLYDPTSQMPISEDSPVVPTSPYAVSKVAQEALAQYYSNRGFKYIIARPFNHIGPGQNPGFIVPDFAQQIIEGEKGNITEISVGNLAAKRDYTDVRDIVRAYRLLVESDAKNEVFNICSGNSVSSQVILDMLLSKSMAKLEIIQDPSRLRPGDIPEIIGDNNKLFSTTGWKPEYTLEQTLQDALEDWRSR